MPQLQRSYHGVRQRGWGTWVAEIHGRETSQRHWLISFHAAELATYEYDRLHDTAAHLNPPWGEAPDELGHPPPGVVSAVVANKDREAREHIAAEAAEEEYMADLRCQYPKLVDAEMQ